VRAGVRSPKKWLKGEGIPPDHITPWELLLYAVSKAFEMMSGGFTGRMDFLFKEHFRVPPNYMSVAGVVCSIWDAINDPPIGAYMDRKKFSTQALRSFIRIGAVTVHFLNVLRMIDGGLSPMGHVIMLCACTMTGDIMGTFAGVAHQKIRSGISPLSQQRGRISVWANMGGQYGWIPSQLPTFFMGFRDFFGWNDYQIIFIGALVFMPFAIISSILPSFVKQRVDFSAQSPLILEEGEPLPGEETMSLRESFAIIRHNRYFIVHTISKILETLAPNIADDELLVYRYLVPKLKFRGEEMHGEAILLSKQMIAGQLCTRLQPFNRQIINKMGGPLMARRIKPLVTILFKLINYLTGYNTMPKIAVMIGTETIHNCFVNIDGIAGEMLNYEWYDYVELKTGVRSEGITAAIDGLLMKIVRNNIGLVTGNAVLQWTGYRGGYTADGTLPPERFLKALWPMYCLMPLCDNLIFFICRCFVRWTPKDAQETEKALAERRAAKQQIANSEADYD